MADRLPLIAANWKMFKRIDEAVVFIGALHHEVGRPADREIVIAPPFTALAAVSAAMRDTAFKLAAQNFHYEEKGAFTGEISGVMLRDVGCEYVILGHSERRHVFDEDDELIQKKVSAAFQYGLTPIFCIGEKLKKREEGKTFKVVGKQLKRGLEGLSAEQAAQVVVAYEPVWAIGTGKTATPEQAQEVHAFIRECISSLFDIGVANRVRIVYGGSVKPDNVDTLMAQPDIDGMLVGGASLEVASFKRIVQFQ